MGGGSARGDEPTPVFSRVGTRAQVRHRRLEPHEDCIASVTIEGWAAPSRTALEDDTRHPRPEEVKGRRGGLELEHAQTHNRGSARGEPLAKQLTTPGLRAGRALLGIADLDCAPGAVPVRGGLTTRLHA